MTPKEKAAELVEKFIQTNGNSFFAKDCALIAVDEILSVIDRDANYQNVYAYFLEVKKEIKNL